MGQNNCKHVHYKHGGFLGEIVPEYNGHATRICCAKKHCSAGVRIVIITEVMDTLTFIILKTTDYKS